MGTLAPSAARKNANVIAASRSVGALGERRFRLLWLGQAASEAGNALMPIALAWAVIEMTGSPSDLGLVLAAALIPRVTLLLVGGVWADRLPRQLMMLVSDVVRAGSQGVFALLFLTGHAELWHLIVAALVYGTAQAFFNPALTGLLPQTVTPERLQQANALMGLTRNTLRVAGPIVGGLLVAGFGPGWLFAVDSGTFVVSAAFLALLGVRGLSRSRARGSFLAELAGGWRELTARSWVWTSVVYYSVGNFAVAPLWVLGPIVAKRDLGGVFDWAIILAGAGIGSIVGSAVALRFRPARPLLAGYLSLVPIAFLPISLVRPLPTLVIAAVALLGMGGLSLSNALWLTALQEHVPAEALSRVSAYEWMGSLVFMPLGYTLAGFLADGIGLDETLWLMAALLGFSTLGILSVPSVRRLRRVGAPELGGIAASPNSVSGKPVT